jgi:hypothetical protein
MMMMIFFLLLILIYWTRRRFLPFYQNCGNSIKLTVHWALSTAFKIYKLKKYIYIIREKY